MKLNIEQEYAYIAMTKVALSMKKKGFGKEFFVDFASEIWDSMLLSKDEDIERILHDKMMADLARFMKENPYK